VSSLPCRAVASFLHRRRLELPFQCRGSKSAHSADTSKVERSSQTAGRPSSSGPLVVYFSLVALRCSASARCCCRAGDTVSRKAGFVFLFVYLAAAVGLLLDDSFLGLRVPCGNVIWKCPQHRFGLVKFGPGCRHWCWWPSAAAPGGRQRYVGKTFTLPGGLPVASGQRICPRIGPHGRTRDVGCHDAEIQRITATTPPTWVKPVRYPRRNRSKSERRRPRK